MSNLISPHEEMLYDNSLNRSPSNATPRTYNPAGLNRQSSRNFEQPYHAQHQPVGYASELHRFEHRSDRLPLPQQLYSNTSYGHNPYEQTQWNAFGAASNAATMGASSRMRAGPRRAALPSNWTDNNTPQLSSYIPSNQYSQIPSQHMAPYSNGYNDSQQTQSISQGGGSPNMGDDEELIPTAIVIKNIPFAVKKEALQLIMNEMHLPVPYAFNYHFDNGVFRGLAFANFSSAEDTAMVIDNMNGLDLQGRKLRVEYKKMLPLQERDRIEREKRERRGQLEEQHRPQAMGSLQTQTSMSSLSSQMIPVRTSPSPVSTRGSQASHNKVAVLKDVDMNDPQTLDYYGQLLKFKDSRDAHIIFEAPLSPDKRKILHSLAQFLGLYHISHGEGEGRFLQILKAKPGSTDPSYQPKLLQHTSNHAYDERRALARAATVDFSEIRPIDPSYYPTLRSQASDYLGVPHSPGGENGINRAGGLRGAKSFGDLQARTSSPSSLSTSSFPAGLSQTASRYANEYQSSMNGGHNGDAPSASSTTRVGQDDSFINGFASMSVFDRQVMPTRSNGRLGGLSNDDQAPSSSGPIGSQRPVQSTNGNYDEQARNPGTVAPERQPRVPTGNWNGFPRPRQNGHNGRGSDELDQHQIEEAWRRT